jgi:hypothetical protein
MFVKAIWFLAGILLVPLIWVTGSFILVGIESVNKNSDIFSLFEILVYLASLVISMAIIIKKWATNTAVVFGIAFGLSFYTFLTLPKFVLGVRDLYSREIQHAYTKVCFDVTDDAVPIVKGYINNHPVRCLIDTGSDVTYIIEDAAIRLNLSLHRDPNIIRVFCPYGGETRDVLVCKIESFGFGHTFVFGKGKFPVIKDEGIYGSGRAECLLKDVDMLLGRNFLKRYNAVIDYPNKVLLLQR